MAEMLHKYDTLNVMARVFLFHIFHFPYILMLYCTAQQNNFIRGTVMQEEPATIIARMNRAYNAVYGTLSTETRRHAENEFYRCQNRLRERGIKFRQTLQGRWVLDDKATESRNT